jgi:hypothetical protein
MTRSRASVESATLLLLLALCGCGGAPADPAAQAAVELFALAREGDPPDAELTARFAEPPESERERATLLDALALLAGQPAPVVVAVERADDPTDAFVDLEVPFEGGGSARYTVRLTADGDDRWRVRWFQGPGIGWPADGGARN